MGFALTAEHPPVGPNNWVREIKHDGYRVIARRTQPRAALQPAGRPVDFSLNAGREPPNGTTMLSKRFTGIQL